MNVKVKLNSKPKTTNDALQIIKNVQITEYDIYKRNRKLNQHFLKWSHCMLNVNADW